MLCGFMPDARRANVAQQRMSATNASRMSSTILVTRGAIDCNAIDHEVIDRNEISIRKHLKLSLKSPSPFPSYNNANKELRRL